MIYFILFYEFLKIGFFAVGGGLTVIPLLFEICEVHNWFSRAELVNYVALVQAVPGPIGLNLAVLTGNIAGGFWGGIVSGLGLTIPSLLLVIWLAKFLQKHKKNRTVVSILDGIRPAGIALVLFAAFEISQPVMVHFSAIFLCVVMFFFMLKVQKNPVIYVLVSAIAGILLGL